MTCEFAHLDGAYVLGALAPAERLEYERHLAGCDECAQRVRELAGVPGLLSRVDVEVLESPPVLPEVPQTLLRALVREVRRRRRRRLLVPVAATAAVLATAGGLAATGVLDADGGASPDATTPASSRMMVPIGHVPVSASVALEGVGWGTRLELTCSYRSGGAPYASPRSTTYSLVVRTRDGRTEQVGSWRSLANKTMHITAGTALAPRQISSVEVWTAKGQTVLELTP